MSDPRIQNLWKVPSLLCLDAPAVAVAWSILWQRSFSCAFSWGAHAGLFCCVWGIYLLDRIADARESGRRMRTTARHRFARRHPRLMHALLASAFAGGVASLPFLPAGTLPAAAATGGAVLVYFLLLRTGVLAALRPWIPAKEMIVAFVFTAGVAVASSPSPGSGFFAAAFLFWVLVLSNCLVISYAERRHDADEDPSAYYGAPAARSRAVPVIAVVGVALASLLSPLAGLPPALAGSCFLAAVALLAVARFASEGKTQALADLSLLVPVPLLLLESLL